MVAGLAASANAQPVTVTDITDWTTTPGEYVYFNDPLLSYNGGVNTGINTLLVTTGQGSTSYNGFCIDPFHWSATGPTSGYSIVPLDDAPKPPATLNAATATEIEELWAEFYSPTMSSSSAAGVQIAIWELVSSNAIANDGLAASNAFTLDGGNDYGASQDLASLATYDGPVPDLTALTGSGQDYVIDIPPSTPDGGATFIMLALALGALIVARPAIIKSASQRGKLQAIPVRRRSSAQGRAN